MAENNVAFAYYQAMSEKNISEVGKYLHPHVTFRSPLAKLDGKEAVLEAIRRFVEGFKLFTIRAKCAQALKQLSFIL